MGVGEAEVVGQGVDEGRGSVGREVEDGWAVGVGGAVTLGGSAVMVMVGAGAGAKVEDIHTNPLRPPPNTNKLMPQMMKRLAKTGLAGGIKFLLQNGGADLEANAPSLRVGRLITKK